MNTRVFTMLVAVMIWNYACVIPSHAEDRQSRTLVERAWKALRAGEYADVSNYADKCVTLYAKEAGRMQASLDDYPQGAPEDIHRYWALNDVATILFIQAEARRMEKSYDEAKALYQRIITDYSYGQAWDPKGFFWKPAQSAREKLQTLDTLPHVEFGDYSSAFLTAQAWQAYRSGDDEAARIYVDKVIEMYGQKAREMQAGLKEVPAVDPDTVSREYWALNDVGTSYFIRGKIYKRQDKPLAARTAFQTIVTDFSFAQWWDPSGKGSFFRAAQAARDELDDL